MVVKPTYLRYIFILQGLVFLTACLWWLGEILVPFLFSGVLAALLNPVNDWMLNKRVPRLLAISLTVLMAVVAVCGLGFFLLIQMTQFTDALPILQKRLDQYTAESQAYLTQKFHLSRTEQIEYFNSGLEKALGNTGDIAVSILGAMSGAAILLTLIPVYVFLILLYKPTMVLFIRQVFYRVGDSRVGEILNEIKTVVQSYISGLLIEAGIVAVLNVVALYILGVDYALLLGFIAAILNMIPYVGGIVGTALPMLIAFITRPDGLTSAMLVLAAFIFIQFLDNNLIQPRIVASKVRINALFTVIGVLAGNMLWGVGGMFLSIPIIAVLKIIFDRVEGLQPWGMLLGDQIPGENEEPSLNEKKKTVVKD